MQTIERFDQKLLVEGNDDQHVIWSICHECKIPESFDVIDSNGIEDLFKSIIPRLLESNLRTLGIVLDADIDIQLRFEKVKSILTRFFPEMTAIELSENGFIYKGEFKKVGVWIMPDNESNGMLEDFINYLVPQNDILFENVEGFITQIEENGLKNYKSIHRSKAKIHNWLSLQDNPGTPMGLAITKKYLEVENLTCQKFVTWLNRLFNE